MELARHSCEVEVFRESGEPMVVEDVTSGDKVPIDLLDDWIVGGECGRHAGS